MISTRAIVYKPTRFRDLVPAAKMILATINHLRAGAGMAVVKRSIRRPPPFIVHLFKTNPELCYCAWHGPKIVGFGLAVVHGKQWYLSDLFVHPKFQDGKIGRELMDRLWRDEPGMTHALATFSYNMQAVGLYSRFGMAVREPLVLMSARTEQFKRPKPTRLKAVSNISTADVNWIHEQETRIRGYSHPTEWRFWLSNSNYTLRLYKDGSRRVGYCLSTADGTFGPAGAITNRYLARIVQQHLATAEVNNDSTLRTFCPTNNGSLYRLLLAGGFRLREMNVLMSDKRYGDFQRYLPADLSVF